MKLVKRGAQWTVDGPGSDKARVAYAISDGQRLTYRLETNVSRPQLLST